MKVLAIIVSIVLLLVCIVLSAVVLMQESKSAGLSGAISGAAETFVGKNRARTMQGKLEITTRILGIAYLVLALVLYFLVA
ncbi:MAG: preprotein translocase subunit SecG [Firmicutes bacterium]|nr:preprotein translocase subunit SecG [Bacillota bacterium]MBR3404550.1 preprotein translocase subunit SecG [Bacillota bacterium]